MSARGGRGLRSRLIFGFVSVALATALVTAATAVVGAFVAFATHPIGSSRISDAFFRVVPMRNASDTAVLWILVFAIISLLILAIGSGYLMAQRMLRPVGELAEAAERVAAGDLAVQLAPTGEDELADLADRFNMMTWNLGASMQELRRLETQARRFASDVAHELRTPLAAMTAVTEVLSAESGAMSADAARATHLVIREISHLERLVTDLIEMSRFDTGVAVLDADVVNVAAAVNACLDRRGWTELVVTEVPEQLRGVLDRRRIDVILANLIGNAVKYGAPPIDITARAVLDAGRQILVISVRDHGPGIAPDALPYLFERFYKADAARRRSDGSGLGLAIAQENAQLHGGYIAAENAVEGGARFALMLPLMMPPREDRAPDQPQRLRR